MDMVLILVTLNECDPGVGDSVDLGLHVAADDSNVARGEPDR